MNTESQLTLSVVSVVILAAAAAAYWRGGSAEKPSGATSGDARVACPTAKVVDQVWIPGGTFQFGTDHAYPEEAPSREMSVEGFWMDRHEVTNAEFARFVEETGHVTVAERSPDPKDYPDIPPENLVPGSAVFSQPAAMPNGTMADQMDLGHWWAFVSDANWRQPNGPGSSIEGMDHLPVVHVAYPDALAYARWAGRDLPSEVEWEFAARGGHVPTAEDDTPTADVGPDGRYRGNTWQGHFPVMNEGKDGFVGLAPVGCFPANGYGLHDMTGNVWEWTTSYYRPNHREAAPDSFDDPRQPGIPVRVIKGGSYLCARNFCWRYRPAARQAQDVGFSTGHIGFRTLSRAPVITLTSD